MDNNYNFVTSCIRISNDDDDDDDDGGGDYHLTIGRSGVTSISNNKEYCGLLHELTPDQVDTSVADFLSVMDSRSLSPINVKYNDAATSEFDHPISQNGTALITPASMRSTISNTTINETMDKVDKPIQKKNNTQDSSKQQQQLHHKERELKCKRRICRIDGCERIVKSQGVCQRHGARTKYCRVNACDKQAQGNFDGMCSKYRYSYSFRSTAKLTNTVFLSASQSMPM